MRLRQKSRIDPSATPREPVRERCENCGFEHPCYNMTTVGGEGFPTQKLCSFCFNSWMSQDLGVPMPDPCEFPPIVLKDGTGRAHTFYFDLKLEDSGVFLVAFEWINDGVGGYQLAVFDRFDVPTKELHERLVYRLKRTLQVQYLDRHKLALRGDAVNGLFTDLNPETGEAEPGVIVDGRFIAWPDFASCFRDLTGFQFRIECADVTEELPIEAQWGQGLPPAEPPLEAPEGRKEEPPLRPEPPHNGILH